MIGQTLSHYRITEKLGAGGMGEVYRATDTKLGRDVAIKVLPAEVIEDPQRLERFQREAHLLASLNHPNIAAIYGLEEADGKPFLVLELVEGEDLKVRLERGAIPVDETLQIAKQIAEALEEAHEKGIVHRDLKPANVKLTPDGKVKVLDFGLAKAYGVEATSGSEPDMSQSPTLAHSGTVAGLILGTAAYMSPEQARGKPVDKRTDIWAFGVLVWEMLTGKPLFSGETVSDVLAGVLTREPDWGSLPLGTPTSARRLLRRCIEREPRQRLRDMGEARLALAEKWDDLEPAPGGGVPEGRRGALIPWAVAALAVLGAAGWSLLGGRGGPTDQAAARFALTAPPGTRLRAVTISPLKLDDALPDAYVSLGEIREVHHHDWAGAEEAFKRAIELNPDHWKPRFYYSFLLKRMGRYAESLNEMQQAHHLDPVSMHTNGNLEDAYLLTGDLDGAIELQQQMVELYPEREGERRAVLAASYAQERPVQRGTG